jgi:hypothetical protein
VALLPRSTEIQPCVASIRPSPPPSPRFHLIPSHLSPPHFILRLWKVFYDKSGCNQGRGKPYSPSPRPMPTLACGCPWCFAVVGATKASPRCRLQALNMPTVHVACHPNMPTTCPHAPHTLPSIAQHMGAVACPRGCHGMPKRGQLHYKRRLVALQTEVSSTTSRG